MTKFSPFLIGLLLSVGLAGCGYHLSGTIDTPQALRTVYLSGASPNLNSEIGGILRASKSRLVGSPGEAGVVIKILKEDMNTRVLSRGNQGFSNESELNFYLRFQYYDNQDNPLMDEQSLEIAREYFNDQTAILAKSNEDAVIRKEIYKQAARMVMARASVALEQQPQQKTKANAKSNSDAP